MLAFFFWFMPIWIFIQIFADIFHRRDLLLGALIYLIAPR
jgi:hypothetical protein